MSVLVRVGLLAATWWAEPEDEDGPTPDQVARAREILRTSERRRFLLVPSIARTWWQVEAVAKALAADAQAELPGPRYSPGGGSQCP